MTRAKRTHLLLGLLPHLLLGVYPTILVDSLNFRLITQLAKVKMQNRQEVIGQFVNLSIFLGNYKRRCCYCLSFRHLQNVTFGSLQFYHLQFIANQSKKYCNISLLANSRFVNKTKKKKSGSIAIESKLSKLSNSGKRDRLKYFCRAALCNQLITLCSAASVIGTNI